MSINSVSNPPHSRLNHGKSQGCLWGILLGMWFSLFSSLTLAFKLTVLYIQKPKKVDHQISLNECSMKDAETSLRLEANPDPMISLEGNRGAMIRLIRLENGIKFDYMTEPTANQEVEMQVNDVWILMIFQSAEEKTHKLEMFRSLKMGPYDLFKSEPANAGMLVMVDEGPKAIFLRVFSDKTFYTAFFIISLVITSLIINLANL